MLSWNNLGLSVDFMGSDCVENNIGIRLKVENDPVLVINGKGEVFS